MPKVVYKFSLNFIKISRTYFNIFTLPSFNFTNNIKCHSLYMDKHSKDVTFSFEREYLEVRRLESEYHRCPMTLDKFLNLSGLYFTQFGQFNYVISMAMGFSKKCLQEFKMN